MIAATSCESHKRRASSSIGSIFVVASAYFGDRGYELGYSLLLGRHLSYRHLRVELAALGTVEGRGMKRDCTSQQVRLAELGLTLHPRHVALESFCGYKATSAYEQRSVHQSYAAGLAGEDLVSQLDSFAGIQREASTASHVRHNAPLPKFPMAIVHEAETRISYLHLPRTTPAGNHQERASRAAARFPRLALPRSLLATRQWSALLIYRVRRSNPSCQITPMEIVSSRSSTNVEISTSTGPGTTLTG